MLTDVREIITIQAGQVRIPVLLTPLKPNFDLDSSAATMVWAARPFSLALSIDHADRLL
jgi:hypothetical protein